MDNYFIRIIDIVIEISFSNKTNCPLKRVLVENYKNYLTDRVEKPDLRVEVKKDYLFRSVKIRNISYLSFYERIKSDKIITSTTINSIQSHLFFKVIIYNLLLTRGVLFIHSSACMVNGKAVVFTGKNGAGKSTIVKMLQKHLTPLCDDMAIITKNREGDLLLYQVPYPEKNRYAKNNTPYPVAGFYFLKKTKTFSVKPVQVLTQQEFINNMSKQIFIDRERKTVFRAILGLTNKIYKLGFSKKDAIPLTKYLKKSVTHAVRY